MTSMSPQRTYLRGMTSSRTSLCFLGLFLWSTQVAAADAASYSPTLSNHDSSIPDTQRSNTPAEFSLSGTAWDSIARQHGLSPYLLYAVALKESAKYQANRRAVSPWPWALHGPHGATYADSREHAAELLRQKLELTPLVDIGMLQINVRWHGHRVQSPEDLLDPLTNLQVGATILAETIRSAPGDLALGVGRYHHWRDEAVARAYGQHVILIYERLLEITGYGR